MATPAHGLCQQHGSTAGRRLLELRGRDRRKCGDRVTETRVRPAPRPGWAIPGWRDACSPGAFLGVVARGPRKTVPGFVPRSSSGVRLYLPILLSSAGTIAPKRRSAARVQCSLTTPTQSGSVLRTEAAPAAGSESGAFRHALKGTALLGCGM